MSIELPVLAGVFGEHSGMLAHASVLSTRRATVLSFVRAHDRGHLQDVNIEAVRNHIRAVGLAEEELISGDELVVDEADPMTLLYLLNEDFFTGGLTTIGFRSERKSPRG